MRHPWLGKVEPGPPDWLQNLIGFGKELATLRGEVKHLESQCGRLQALLRASQRVVGLSAPSVPKAKAGGAAKKRKKRRPQVRALRAAATLRSEPENLVESGEEKRHDAREVKA